MNRIQLLDNSHKEIVNNYLSKHEVETTFIIGNVKAFGLENDKNIRRGADYYGYFEDDSLVGILPFYNLGSCIPHYSSKSAIPFFADIMRERNFEFLLGMESIVKPLYEEIKASKTTLEYSEDSYFVNKNFSPFNLEGIAFVDASAEKEPHIEFIQRANLEGFGNKRSREDVINTLVNKPQEEDFIFIEVEGKLRAQANVQTTTASINQVGGVFTSLEERGNGYCKAAVSEICRRILSRGKTPTLMVTKNNTPAVKAYTSLGFTHYDDYLIIKLEAI